MNCPFCGRYHYGSPYTDSRDDYDYFPMPHERPLKPLFQRCCQKCEAILAAEYGSEK